MKFIPLILLIALQAAGLPLTKFDSLMLVSIKHSANACDSILVQPKGGSVQYRSKSELRTDIGAGAPWDSAGKIPDSFSNTAVRTKRLWGRDTLYGKSNLNINAAITTFISPLSHDSIMLILDTPITDNSNFNLETHLNGGGINKVLQIKKDGTAVTTSIGTSAQWNFWRLWSDSAYFRALRADGPSTLDSVYFRTARISNTPGSATPSDSILVQKNGVVCRRTKAQILSDIGAPTAYDSAGKVPDSFANVAVKSYRGWFDSIYARIAKIDTINSLLDTGLHIALANKSVNITANRPSGLDSGKIILNTSANGGGITEQITIGTSNNGTPGTSFNSLSAGGMVKSVSLNGLLKIASAGTDYGSPWDSAGVAHIADTCKHEKDSVRAAYKSDTSKVSAYATRADTSRTAHFSDSTKNSHKADTSVKAHFSDSTTNAHKADTSIKSQRAVFADSSNKSHISDTALHSPNHGVTVGTLPVSATSTTWGNSLLSQSGGTITAATGEFDLVKNTGGAGLEFSLQETYPTYAGRAYFGLYLGNLFFQNYDAGGGISWYIGGTNVMTLLNNGNLGIGYATPAQKLVVIGDINCIGYMASGAAPAGHFLKGDGTHYVDGTITAAEMPTGTVSFGPVDGDVVRIRCATNEDLRWGIGVSSTGLYQIWQRGSSWADQGIRQTVDRNGITNLYGSASTDVALRYTEVLYDATDMAIGHGSGIEFTGKYKAAGDYAGFGGIGCYKENSTEANLASYMSLCTRVAGGDVTERMHISSTGLVGVGTAAPDSLLTVNGSADVKGKVLAGDVYTVPLTNYSSSANPQGFSSFDTLKVYYKKTGTIVSVWFNIGGVSNANLFTFTLPYVLTTTGFFPDIEFNVSGYNAYVPIHEAYRLRLIRGSTTAQIDFFYGGSAFVNANRKSAMGFFQYITD
jgi:hypothetical protein